MGTWRLWMDENNMIELLILFIVLQLADAATTVYGVKKGLREFNPIMSLVHTNLGLYGGLFLMKVPITAIVTYIVVTGQVGITFMGLLVVPFLALLINNLYWIYRNNDG